MAPAKARPGVKNSMLGRSHARAATNFALMNSEPKAHEYDAPADPGENAFIVEMHQSACWQLCAQYCSCIHVRCTVVTHTLAANCSTGDQVIHHHFCLAIHLQGNLKSMLKSSVLLPINNPLNAKSLPTYIYLTAEHHSAQTQI